jgi:hypothetical protein
LFLRCFGFLRSGFVVPDQNSRIDLGLAGFGVVWQGKARQGKARQGKAVFI